MADAYRPWGPPPQFGTGYGSIQRKVGPGRMVLTGGGLLVVLVVVITLIAVVSRSGGLPCLRGCPPPTSQVVKAATYQNQRWGYSVPYDRAVLAINNQNSDGAEFDAKNGDGGVSFTATSGSDVNGATQKALDALPSSTFQNLRQIGPVRGAEIGLVSGQGSAWSGDYVDSSGSGATPIGVVIFSSARNGVIITVTAFGAASNDNADMPYGLAIGQELDFPVTFTRWKGQ